MSDFFSIEKGVRQGCPLSPYLFICAIELLYRAINKNGNIISIGYSVANTQFKYTSFADDATFFLNGTQQSLQNLTCIIKEYSKSSGLKLNNSKSENWSD